MRRTFLSTLNPQHPNCTAHARTAAPARLLLLPLLAGLSAPSLLGSTATALHAAEQKAPEPAPAAAPRVAEDAYILGPGDSIGLQIFDAPELSGTFEVLNDGTVPLPLVGSVRVEGLTLSQAQQWFTGLLRQQLQRPDLLLRVVRPRPIRVALVGEVERPGLYSLTTSETSQIEGAPASISGLPTVVDAIQKAGGITLNANLRDVQLQRRLPGDQARFKRARLNLLNLLLEGDQLQNPLLFDGDTIRIGKAEQPVAEAVELAATNLSPQQIQINVVGEVVSPGRLGLPASLPLNQAVLAAGGPRPGRASEGNVELIRIERNGTVSRQRFRLNLGQSASNAQNPPLRDGDTVIVHRSGLAVASDTINTVTTPLTGLASILALIDIVNRN